MLLSLYKIHKLRYASHLKFYTSTLFHVLFVSLFRYTKLRSLLSITSQRDISSLVPWVKYYAIINNACRTRIISVDSCKKMQKAEQITGDSESSTSGSPSVHRTSSSQQKQLSFDLRDGRRSSVTGRKGENTQAGDLFSATAKGRRPPPVRTPCIQAPFSVITPLPSLYGLTECYPCSTLSGSSLSPSTGIFK